MSLKYVQDVHAGHKIASKIRLHKTLIKKSHKALHVAHLPLTKSHTQSTFSRFGKVEFFTEYYLKLYCLLTFSNYRLVCNPVYNSGVVSLAVYKYHHMHNTTFSDSI